MFPQSSLDWVIEKIMKKGKGYPSLQEYVIDLMKKLDRNGDGVISFEEFSSGLKNLDIFITDHEEHTLMRRFDSNNDNKISMEEFYNTLASFA
jgi:Ca2+-binding EF-hand superfamily protein